MTIDKIYRGHNNRVIKLIVCANCASYKGLNTDIHWQKLNDDIIIMHTQC